MAHASLGNVCSGPALAFLSWTALAQRTGASEPSGRFRVNHKTAHYLDGRFNGKFPIFNIMI
jgi:hypothetical protein